jgi:hypothetical protein
MKRETTYASRPTETECQGDPAPGGHTVQPTTTTSEADTEAKLIAGFLSRKPGADSLLIVELEPLLRSEVQRRWRRFIHHKDDLVQSALVKLCELRETEEGRAAITPPLDELAKALVDAPARRLKRAPEMLPLEDRDAPVPPDQEDLARLKYLLNLAQGLPLPLRTALRAHAAHQLGEGPPPHVALGSSENAARMQVTRAIAAVYRLAKEAAEKETKEAEENDE